jgi:hypothetical protein
MMSEAAVAESGGRESAGLPTIGASARYQCLHELRGNGRRTKILLDIGAVVKSASSVALSADGNLVVIGAADDNRGTGAARVFTRKPSGSDEHAERALCREHSNNILSCSTSVSNAE